MESCDEMGPGSEAKKSLGIITSLTAWWSEELVDLLGYNSSSCPGISSGLRCPTLQAGELPSWLGCGLGW